MADKCGPITSVNMDVHEYAAVVEFEEKEAASACHHEVCACRASASPDHSHSLGHPSGWIKYYIF